jgi:hypothetical protein
MRRRRVVQEVEIFRERPVDAPPDEDEDYDPLDSVLEPDGDPDPWDGPGWVRLGG